MAPIWSRGANGTCSNAQTQKYAHPRTHTYANHYPHSFLPFLISFFSLLIPWPGTTVPCSPYKVLGHWGPALFDSSYGL